MVFKLKPSFLSSLFSGFTGFYWVLPGFTWRQTGGLDGLTVGGGRHLQLLVVDDVRPQGRFTLETEWESIVNDRYTTEASSKLPINVVANLFGLEAVGPDAFQEVAQAGDERVVLDVRQRHVAVAELDGLVAHFADQQPLRLRLALLRRRHNRWTRQN